MPLDDATTQAIYEGIRKADAAGDTDGVRKLSAYLHAPTPPQSAPTQEEAPEPSSLATRVGHGALDVAGGVARGAGDVVGAAKNLYHMANNEPTAPVTETGESFAEPFQHAPDVPIDSAYNRAMKGTKTLGEDIATSAPGRAALESNTGRLVTDIARPVAEIGGAAATVAGGAAALRSGLNLADTALNAGKAPSETAAAHQGLQTARADGFKITPNDARAATAGDVTGAQSSTPNDVDAAQTHNIPKATSGMATDVKLPTKTSINADEISQRMADEGKVYDQVGQAVGTGATPTPTLAQDIQAARASSATTKGQAAIDAQVDHYQQRFAKSVDGPDAVQAVRTLRFDAKGRMLDAENPDNVALGRTNQRIADAIEGELGRQIPVQEPGLLSRFQEARTQIAKLHELQDVTDGGQVNPAKVLALKKAGAPLSGASASVANAADVAPESMGIPGGAPTSHATPVGHYGVERTAFNAAKGIVRKLPGLNPMSDAYQEAHYGPEGGSATTPPAGQPTVSEVRPPVSLQAPPGTASTPRQAPLPLAPGREPAPGLELEHPPGVAFEPSQRPLASPPGRTNVPRPMDRADWDRAALEAANRYKGESSGTTKAFRLRESPSGNR